MDNKYFDLFNEGIKGELDLLDLDGMADYFDNYTAEIILHQNLIWPFISSIVSRENALMHPRMPQILQYCLHRFLQITPWAGPIIDLMSRLNCAPDNLRRSADILNRLNYDQAAMAGNEQLLAEHHTRSAAAGLNRLLEKYPDYALAASMLLEIDAKDNKKPGAWLNNFKCPEELKTDWLYQLFIHHAELCAFEQALSLWERLPDEAKNPYAAVLAADMLYLAGDKEAAINLYARATSTDPLLYPARLRLKELQSPTRPDPEATEKSHTVICLYSYNKAAMLQKMLQSLAACHLGPAKIKILLNGCTDDSRERVEGCLKLFPRNEIEIIDLPVNIGAPAARNWLIHLPDCRRSEFMAFMDDDVTLQADFLDYFIPLMHSDPRRAVIGGKILFPGAKPTIQYLYRTICLMHDGILKMSLNAPKPHCPDTGLYSFTRDTLGVMGCLHLLRTKAMQEIGDFDIRFSPSQVDDLDHDLCVCLAGYKVTYCGLVSCVHQQDSGIGAKRSTTRIGLAALGSIIGNDLKLCYKHMEDVEKLRELVHLNRHKAHLQAR